MNGALRHTMAAITSAVLAIQVAISIPGAPLSALVLSFMVYGFAGWLWESTVCAMLNHGSFSNSGFLLGPCCPIYGVGALVCWFALRGIENVPVQFLAAGALCCCIEYLVGVILEVTTHARFWDYSDMPLNFQGRICLYGFLMFGAGCVLICRVAEPALLGMLASMPVWAVRALALAALTLLAVDAAASMASFRRLSDSLEELRGELADRINDSLKDASDSLVERIPETALDSAQMAHVRGRAINGWLLEISDAVMDSLREKVEMPAFIADGARGLHLAAQRLADAAPRPHLSKRSARKISISKRDLRFFNAFPHLRMMKYEGVIRATRLKAHAYALFRRKGL